MAWNLEVSEVGRLAERASRNLNLLYGGDSGTRPEPAPGRHELSLTPNWGHLTESDVLVPFRPQGPPHFGIS
jgi:hypothetical protein